MLIFIRWPERNSGGNADYVKQQAWRVAEDRNGNGCVGIVHLQARHTKHCTFQEHMPWMPKRKYWRITSRRISQHMWIFHVVEIPYKISYTECIIQRKGGGSSSDGRFNFFECDLFKGTQRIDCRSSEQGLHV